MIPVARTKDLITTDHPEGLVVYDNADHHAHSLNAVSAFVWLESDGVNTVEDIAAHLGTKLGRAAERAEMRALVLMAVSQLRESGLMLNDVQRGADSTVPDGISRRAAAAAIGKAALVMGGILPVVYSLVAPEPAFANSGVRVHPVTGVCTVVAQACVSDQCTGNCFPVTAAGTVVSCTCA